MNYSEIINKKKGEKTIVKVDANKMRLAMARKCMDAKDLAVSVECSVESIHQILGGRRNVTTKKLGKIAKALEVDPEMLLINE